MGNALLCIFIIQGAVLFVKCFDEGHCFCFFNEMADAMKCINA